MNVRLGQPADKFGQGVPAAAPSREVELAPGSAIQSDAELEAWIRSAAETTYHPVGTCKMGIDDMAVVDPMLRVHGVQALRVVDASVMPTLVGANTNAATTMIAEKAAELILRDAGVENTGTVQGRP